MWILETLNGLPWLKMLILNPSMINPQSLNDPYLLFFPQTGSHWIVWHKKYHADSDSDCNHSKDEEHDLPGSEGFCSVVLKAKRGHCSDYTSRTDTTVPESDTSHLLMFLIPHGGKQNHTVEADFDTTRFRGGVYLRWSNTGLEAPKQYPRNREGSETFTCSCRGNTDTEAYDCERSIT